MVILCDTNGGMLPAQIQAVVSTVLADTGARLGIHAQDDTGCAVANTLAAVDAGATHVQCTANGYGERVGNANLFPVVAALELKYGKKVLPDGALREMTRISHAIAEVVNLTPSTHQPYVGVSAFAHKAGLHASAIKVDPDLYQHIDPEQVGNTMRMLVSDMAGRASIELKGKELGIDLGGDRELVGRVVERVKERELKGYTYEAADASLRAAAARRGRGQAAPLLPDRVLAGDRRGPPRRHPRQRGHGQAVGQGRAHRRHGRGQRPGQRAGPRAARRPGADLPPARQAGAGRLQGPHPGGQARHRVHDPRPDLHGATARASGPRSASPRTSSPRPGRRWRTRTRTGCCGRASSRRSNAPEPTTRPAPSRPRQCPGGGRRSPRNAARGAQPPRRGLPCRADVALRLAPARDAALRHRAADPLPDAGGSRVVGSRATRPAAVRAATRLLRRAVSRRCRAGVAAARGRCAAGRRPGRPAGFRAARGGTARERARPRRPGAGAAPQGHAARAALRAGSRSGAAWRGCVSPVSGTAACRAAVRAARPAHGQPVPGAQVRQPARCTPAHLDPLHRAAAAAAARGAAPRGVPPRMAPVARACPAPATAESQGRHPGPGEAFLAAAATGALCPGPRRRRPPTPAPPPRRTSTALRPPLARPRPRHRLRPRRRAVRLPPRRDRRRSPRLPRRAWRPPRPRSGPATPSTRPPASPRATAGCGPWPRPTSSRAPASPATPASLADVLRGLDHLDATVYNPATTRYGNWWEWQIGSPRLLTGHHRPLLYDAARRRPRRAPPAPPSTTSSPTRCSATTPAPAPAPTASTCAASVALRGILGARPAKIALARDALSPVFPYVTQGDGLYADGSFVQHTWVAYSGTYGTGHARRPRPALRACSPDPSWAVTDPNRQIILDSVEQAYAPARSTTG